MVQATATRKLSGGPPARPAGRRALAGRGTADVLEMPTPTLRILKEQGLLAEYYLPNAAAYPAAAKEPGSDQNLYWAVDREHYISFGYNTNLLPATAVPKDVAGLA